MKRVLVVIFLVVILFLLGFWIWHTARLLDENNSLQMEVEKAQSERDNIDKLYQEKVREIGELRKKALVNDKRDGN